MDHREKRNDREFPDPRRRLKDSAQDLVPASACKAQGNAARIVALKGESCDGAAGRKRQQHCDKYVFDFMFGVYLSNSTCLCAAFGRHVVSVALQRVCLREVLWGDRMRLESRVSAEVLPLVQEGSEGNCI